VNDEEKRMREALISPLLMLLGAIQRIAAVAIFAGSAAFPVMLGLALFTPSPAERYVVLSAVVAIGGWLARGMCLRIQLHLVRHGLNRPASLPLDERLRPTMRNMLLLPFLMSVGLLDLAGTLAMVFGGGIFVVMAVLMIALPGPGHQPEWGSLELPGAIALVGWLARGLSRWVETELKRRGVIGSDSSAPAGIPRRDWGELARLRRAARAARSAGDNRPAGR
jgi:hypothetical protein